MVYVGYVCGWMCTAKTAKWNELKLSTVDLDTMSQPTDLRFKRARVGFRV